MSKSPFLNALFNFGIRLGIEYALLLGGLYVYDASHAGANSLVGLVVLQIFRFLNGALGICVTIFMYFITKRSRIRYVVSCLYAAKFPCLDEMRFMEDATDAFRLVAASDDANKDARNFAAGTLGELNALRLLGRPIALLQAGFVLNAAFAQYRGERDAARP